ncbi:MAG: divalent metal cation transporter [Actinobacteria bacterium]|nr:divalent metal cation transporter [Actinomycetota bacterium]
MLIPVLMVNQEMVARLGAVSGLGHGRLIRERLGRRWGNLATGSILLLNFLILITEFIGISLSTSYFGAPAYITVPLAAVLLFTVTAAGTFRSWERLMMLFVAVNVLIVPLLFVTNASGHATMHGLIVPSIRGGATSGGILLIISIIGTTVAPWQLFFQQSNIVDKRITPRWLNYERVDTLLGSIIVVVSASVIIIAAAAGLSPHGDTSSYTDALGVAQGFAQYVGHGSGAMFAILLLNASIIGAAAVTLASSYAFGDLTGSRQPLGIITLAVQAMCGLMLPSTTIFVLMLANDREVLGPWTNTRWMNAIATVVIGALIALSVTLMVSTLFPGVNVMRLLVDLSVVVGCVLAILVPWTFIHTGPAPTYDIKRADWRMPRLALVTPLPMSRGRRFLLRSVAVYLVVAGVMLVWRMIQLGVHQ